MTQPRHIGLFLSGLAGGGAQRRMSTLARGFAALGHRVDLVVVDAQGPFRSALTPDVHLVELGSRLAHLPGIAPRRGLWVPTAAPRLARYLRSERPCALLATSNPANLAAVWARRRAHVPTALVLSVNLDPSAATGSRQRAWRWLLRALVRRAYPRADRLVALSQGVADSLETLAKVPHRRIAVVHNPIDVDAIREQARAPLSHRWLRPGQPPLVLAVGKLKRQKDFPTLLRAFARVRAQRPAHLVILGEGEERHHLEALARRLGIAAEMELPGFTQNPFAWMSRASLLVSSSAWEGFSNVLAEALACACPVVATDCPSGPAEILEGGRLAPLVPVGDDEAMANAILQVLAHPPDRNLLRRRAQDFSVDQAVRGYLTVIEAAVAEVETGAGAPARGHHACRAKND